MKRRISIALCCAAVAVLTVPRALTAYVDLAPSAGATTARPAARDGVWVWTTADAEAFSKRGSLADAAIPGVLVLSLELDASGALRGRRGLSPAIPGAREVAAVVRIEDGVAPHLDDPLKLAADLDARLAAMRAEVEATGVDLVEVQLDFDVPVRRLEAWARVAGAVAMGSLAGKPLSITSIPAHLAEPRYGALFQGQVAGHVFQTFDTGLACNAREIATARERLARARMPFRVGIATFERAKSGQQRTTEHLCWANASRQLWPAGTYAGTYAGGWVFPAGRSVDDAFSTLQAD